MNALLKFAALALLFPAATSAVAQTDYFTNWPDGSSPQDVGKRLAEHFVTTPHQGNRTIFYGESPPGTARSPSLSSPTTTRSATG